MHHDPEVCDMTPWLFGSRNPSGLFAVLCGMITMRYSIQCFWFQDNYFMFKDSLAFVPSYFSNLCCSTQSCRMQHSSTLYSTVLIKMNSSSSSSPHDHHYDIRSMSKDKLPSFPLLWLALNRQSFKILWFSQGFLFNILIVNYSSEI